MREKNKSNHKLILFFHRKKPQVTRIYNFLENVILQSN